MMSWLGGRNAPATKSTTTRSNSAMLFPPSADCAAVSFSTDSPHRFPRDKPKWKSLGCKTVRTDRQHWRPPKVTSAQPGDLCHARHPLAKLLGWTTSAVNSVCKILFPPIAWTLCWSLILPTFAIFADSLAAPEPCFSPKRRAVFITDGRYTEQARAEVPAARIVIARQGLLAAAAAWLSSHQKKGRRVPSRDWD